MTNKLAEIVKGLIEPPPGKRGEVWGNFVALTDENPAATDLEKVRAAQALDTLEHEKNRGKAIKDMATKKVTANENELEDILSVKP